MTPRFKYDLIASDRKMPDEKPQPKKSVSADWLVGGVLSKIGETFDKLTGRNWKPTSSLATSELIERLKKLLDAKARDLGEKGRFVPHNIKLKMQWDKFSTDADAALRKLETELHAAAIDHINDNRYHTYAPFKVAVTPDYFTEGVEMQASFDKFVAEDSESAIKVTMPQMRVGEFIPEPPPPEPMNEVFIAEFDTDRKHNSVELEFVPGKRLNVGRTKENSLTIDDASVSKIHASLVLNGENKLMVADTGSTNGTFIGGERIAYGKAFPIEEGAKVKFGTVEVSFRRVPPATEFVTSENYAAAENFSVPPRVTTEVNAIPKNGADDLQTNSDVSGEFKTITDLPPENAAAKSDFVVENAVPPTQPKIDFDEN